MLLCHTLSDSQPAAVSIEDGPSEDRRHVADEQTDSYTWPELKFTLTYWQVVDLQTVEYRKNKVSASPLCLCVYVNLCLCASSYLSRPYLIVPIKARDFSPFILGYLACWNAASITFVVFSFTARGMQRHQHKGKDAVQRMQSVSALMWQRQRVRVYRSRRMKSGCHRKRWKCQISHITKLEENCI